MKIIDIEIQKIEDLINDVNCDLDCEMIETLRGVGASDAEIAELYLELQKEADEDYISIGGTLLA